jgi:hypothetical protein
MDLSQGDHVKNLPDPWDAIPAGQLGGTQETPILVAPPDWHESGVPYGAWCKCHRCDLIFRSTLAFDCHAKEPGDKLECENCCFYGPQD